MGEPMTVLNEALLNALQQQKLVFLGTIDADSGNPVQQAISWIYAGSESHLRLAVDSRSRIIKNVTDNANCVITLFADGSVFALNGSATVREQLLENVPLKLACIDVQIEAVRDIMYYGSRISVEPACEKTYDLRAAEKLDQQVFAAMKMIAD